MNIKHRFIGLITSAALCLPIQYYFSDVVVAQELQSSKISIELQEVLDEIDNNDLVSVCLWFEDIDYEAVNEATLNNTCFSEESLLNRAYDLYKPLNGDSISESEFIFSSEYGYEKSEPFFTGSEVDDIQSVSNERLQILMDFYETNQNEISQLSMDVDTYICEKRSVAREEYNRHNQEFICENLKDENITFVSSYAPMIIGEMTKEKIIALNSIDAVESISLYIDHEWQQMGNIDVSVSSIGGAYNRDVLGYNGSGVKVGEIDVGRPFTGINELVSANIYLGGTNIFADHSTLVAAIIVGTDGMVPQAQLYCTTSDNFYQNAESLISAGVTVINSSVGYYNSGIYDYDSKWVDHIVNQHNVSWVQASGNAGPDGYVGTPANAYNAITVGAINDNGTVSLNDDTYASFTSYNTFNSGMPMKPDVVAPGVGFSVSGVTPDSGTSYAAPHVTGMVAQMMYFMPTLSLRPDAIKAAVLASCSRKVSGETMVWITDKEGAGVIDACNSIDYIYDIAANQKYLEVINSSIIRTFSSPTQVTKTVAISWLKHNEGTGTNHANLSYPTLTDFDLRIYDNAGNIIASSLSPYNNAELVRFTANPNVTYKIEVVRVTNNTTPEKITLAYLN